MGEAGNGPTIPAPPSTRAFEVLVLLPLAGRLVYNTLTTLLTLLLFFRRSHLICSLFSLRPLAVLSTLVTLLLVPGFAAAQTPPNILVMFLDDLGMEHIGLYGIGSEFIPTPNIDSIAADGLLFQNAWAYPVCSATRGALLTGRFPFRTGLGESVQSDADLGLQPEELTLAEALRFHAPTPYATGAFGKWHLGMDETLGGISAPNDQGFEHFEGTQANLEPVGETYYDYTKITDGTSELVSGYLTSDTVNWAADWIATAPEPWFAYISFNAPHSPVHMPDPELHSQDPGDLSTLNQYRAMAETADTEISRLLAAVDTSNTVIFVLSDNGSASVVTLDPFVPSRSKQTPFEGGVRVPFVVGGGPVALGSVDHPVNVADVFATVVDLANVTLPEGDYDGVSFASYFDDSGAGPVRTFNYTEKFSPNGVGGSKNTCFQAARDDRYKWLTNGSKEGFIDLEEDPFETIPLRWSQLSGSERDRFDEIRGWVENTLDAACCNDAKVGESCFFNNDCCSRDCAGFFFGECE